MDETAIRIERPMVAMPYRGAFTWLTSRLLKTFNRCGTQCPTQTLSFEKMAGTKLEDLARLDPTRVLYNARVPFALASLEHFFSRCFKILLRYDAKAQKKLISQSRKVELEDAIAIRDGARTLEDIVADWYSFQSVSAIHKAFSECSTSTSGSCSARREG
jgi:hypothetical protein